MPPSDLDRTATTRKPPRIQHPPGLTKSPSSPLSQKFHVNQLALRKRGINLLALRQKQRLPPFVPASL